MILAGIDIGTNTLRLLIADVEADAFREIHSDRKITRLGQDIERTGALSYDAMDRSLSVLAEFSEKIGRFAVERTAAVGTSALRKAGNALAFIKKAREKTGLDVRVVSGEEEARLTLLGVSRIVKIGPAGKGESAPDSAMIIDIGGGSTEIILTGGNRPLVETSLHLGAVYLTERHLRSNPPLESELNALRQSVRMELADQATAIRPDKGALLTGTAGTITTLAAIDQGIAEYDPEKINRYVLDRVAVDGIVRMLGSMTTAERKGVTGLEPGREDIILAGAVIAQEIMEWFGFERMIVSDWGLREGIVLDLYEKLSREQRAEGNRHGA